MGEQLIADGTTREPLRMICVLIGGGCMTVLVCQTIHLKWIQFVVCKLYLNKIDFLKIFRKPGIPGKSEKICSSKLKLTTIVVFADFIIHLHL